MLERGVGRGVGERKRKGAALSAPTNASVSNNRERKAGTLGV